MNNIFDKSNLHKLGLKDKLIDSCDNDATHKEKQVSKKRKRLPPGHTRTKRVVIEDEIHNAIEENSGNLKKCKLSDINFDEHNFECFGCQNCIFGTENAELNALVSLFSENFGKMHEKNLFKIMADKFEKCIRQPLLEEGEDCLPWTAEHMQIHFMSHLNEPTIEINRQVEELKKLDRILLDHSIVKQDEKSGDLEIDSKQVELSLKVKKEIKTLLQSQPSKMLFYNPSLDLDASRNT